ncbi:MFS transporter [Streptomyces sp. NPDC056337]|uniref:MFS transporter n=1 Tax=Streptomyces sp. NPDC056337 TaxID=3345787 RepID=UPI0035D5A6B0
MGPFALILAGHLASLVGNSVLRFGLIVQTWTQTGRATDVVLLSLCAIVPQIAMSPTAGALVDRMHRRTALQMADAGGLVAVGALCLVYFLHGMKMELVYVAVALVGAAAAFQYPALLAAVPTLVRKDQLQRANGLFASAKNGAELGGPALGGVLVALPGLGAILLVDLASFVIALSAVRLARFTEPEQSQAQQPAKRLLAESLEGLRELWQRPSLRDLVAVDFLANLVTMLGFAVMQPMILARTGNDISALAAVNISIGIGSLAGGLLLAIWGGPRNRPRGMILGIAGLCLSSQIAMAAADSVVGWCLAILCGVLLIPMVNGAMQSVIQTKVPPALQGRVLGAVSFVSDVSLPIAMAASGPLADHIFEPQAATDSGLVHLLGPVVGEGPGAGMAALLFLAGICGLGAALWGLSRRTVRDIERLLPDLDTRHSNARNPEGNAT